MPKRPCKTFRTKKVIGETASTRRKWKRERKSEERREGGLGREGWQNRQRQSSVLKMTTIGMTEQQNKKFWDRISKTVWTARSLSQSLVAGLSLATPDSGNPPPTNTSFTAPLTSVARRTASSLSYVTMCKYPTNVFGGVSVDSTRISSESMEEILASLA